MPGYVELLFEVAALSGVFLAILSSRYGPWRRRWLQYRFVTEILRQWHFRALLDGRHLDALADSEESRREF